MKRLLSFILILSLLLFCFPARFRADAAQRVSAPDITIKNNVLFLDGSPVSTSYVFNRFDFLWVKAADYTPELRAKCDAENLLALDIKALIIMPDGENVSLGSYIKETGALIKLNFGDVILARSRSYFTGNGIASEWCEIVLHASMFTPSTALTYGDLPEVTVTESGLTAVTSNIYTRYEYTIIPQTQPAGFTPEWFPLGSAYENGSGQTITKSFLPRSTPYTVCVRIEGDSKKDFLFTKSAGIPVAAPKVMPGLEKLGPLNGGDARTAWLFSTNGGKSWDVLISEPGEDAFIDLSGIYSKKDVAFQLKKDAVSEEGNSEPSADAVTVLSVTLKARPAFPKEFALNAFVSEQYPLNWTIKGGKGELEVSVDGVEWTPLRADIGLPLLTVENQSSGIKATAYKVRVAAVESSGVPASVPKKFTQPKQVKAPSAKPDYKRETIKLKNGLKYAIAEPGLSMGNLTFKNASGDAVPIGDAITEKQVIYVYVPENGKKSRSAMQTITLAERAVSPDEGEGLTLVKNNAKLQKGFEYYGSKDKWGSFTKGDTKGLIRRKATAKYNAKAGTNTGLAASKAINCAIVYNGKNVESVTIEPKDDIPLQGWGLTSLTGGEAAYGSFAEGVADSSIVMKSVTETVGFTIAPVFAQDVQPLVASVTVLRDETEVSPTNGTYTFTGLRYGNTVTLSIEPADRDAYRVTKATITIALPYEERLSGVAFGSAGNYGMAAVTLPSAVPLGQSRIIKVELYRNSEKEPVYTEEITLEYSPEATGSTVTVDIRDALTGAGAGSYELRACSKGREGASSDSAPVTAYRTFSSGDFAINTVNVTVPGVLCPGAVVTVENLRDNIGNELTGSAYQWSRVTASGYSANITDKGNDKSYTVTDADLGYKLSVLIYCNGLYFTYDINRQVTAG